MKCYKFLFVIALLIAAALVTGSSLAAVPSAPSNPAALQSQVILDPTAVAWVSSSEPGTSFGGQGFMWVGYGHGTGASLGTLRGLVQFDLSGIPAGAIVTDARLYATIWDAQGPDDHFLYCPGSVIAAWDETTITWNNKPGLVGGGICTDISATTGQVSWDMTTVVQEMYAGLRPNYGFYLTRINDESDLQEHTRLFGSPQLLITYEQVQGLDCAGAVSLACGQSYQGNSAGAPANVDEYGCVGWELPGPERVHKVTTTSMGDLTASLSEMSADLDVFILGDCDPNSCLAYGDTKAVYENAPPGTYYVVVDTDTQGGPYTLDVACGQPAPTSTPTPQGNPSLEVTRHEIINLPGGSPTEGQSFTIEVELRNTGDTSFPSVTLINSYDPDHVHFVLADILPRGSGAGQNYWEFPFFDPGDIRTLHITFLADAPGQTWDTISGSGTDEHGNTVNFADTLDYTILPAPTATPTPTPTASPRHSPTPTTTPQPLLTFTKTDRRDPIDAGEYIYYDLVLEATGDRELSNVSLSDEVPSGTYFVEATNGGYLEGGVVYWEIGSMSPGQHVEVQLTLGTYTNVTQETVITNQAGASFTAYGGEVRMGTSAEESTTILPRPTATHTPSPTITPTPTGPPPPTSTPTTVPTVTPTSSVACTEQLRNGDFEWGTLRRWQPHGLPLPHITDEQVHSGDYSALLGDTETTNWPEFAWIYQSFTIPPNATSAPLSFWYKVRSEDGDVDYDWFDASLLDSDGDVIANLVHTCQDDGWQLATADLTPFAGQTVIIRFLVRNDGNGGSTWAYVDDVSLCTQPPGAVPTATPWAGMCWKGGALPDYAPNGLPDFDQRQEKWQHPTTGRWSYDGPAAAANSLWWTDSHFETGTTSPPTIADTYPLVEAYNGWDDHDLQNVPYLIEDLARRMDTDGQRTEIPHQGTRVGTMVSALRRYIAGKGLADNYTVMLRHAPGFDWVRDRVKRSNDVILLLGFWELQPEGWRRLGGHYVTVAGVGCEDEWIALSDPYYDRAEEGWPGRVRPLASHGHPDVPPDTVHNEATYISHDLYGLTYTATGGASFSGGWGPRNYARTFDDIAPFWGQNFARNQESARATAYNKGTIVTQVDYAVVVVPAVEEVTLWVDPALNAARVGQTFTVDLRVDTGTQAVDAAQAYLDFDPTVLTVVDEAGNPVTAITSGLVLTNVLTNNVDNAAGQIDFAATVSGTTAVSGTFALGTVRFLAQAETAGITLTLSTAEPRRSDVQYQAASVLSKTENAQVIIEAGATISGMTRMESRPEPPDSAWSVPLLLTLQRPGQRGLAYILGLLSDRSGGFDAKEVIAPDGYHLRLKGLHTLRNIRSHQEVAAGSNNVSMGTLLEGDANNDNAITVQDVSLLAAAYDTAQGEDGFDPRADFNEDDAVNGDDLALLQANLGQRGDIVVSEKTTRAMAAGHTSPEAWEIASHALDASAILACQPATNEVRVGQVFSVTFEVQAGIQAVDGVELHLDFDPEVLQVVDADGQPASGIMPGTQLSFVLQNSADNALGRVDYLAAQLFGSPPSGTFAVGTARFKALAESESTWLRFALTPSRASDVTYQGASVLAGFQAGEVQITPAGYELYLPLVTKG